MKRIQLFINRYYDAIKLTLLFLVLFMALIILLNQLTTNDQAARQRAAAVTDILQSVKDSDKRQTEQLEHAIDTLSRQNRALCVVVIEVTGQEGLSKLDAETRARCQSLGQQTSVDVPDATTPEPSQTAQSRPIETSAPPDPSRAQTPRTAPQTSPSAPVQPTQPTTPPDEPGLIRNLIGLPFDVIDGLL